MIPAFQSRQREYPWPRTTVPLSKTRVLLHYITNCRYVVHGEGQLERPSLDRLADDSSLRHSPYVLAFHCVRTPLGPSYVLTNHLLPVVDAVPFYPEELRVPPTSPLHFLERLRNYYIATFNDPIVQWTSDLGHDNWIPLFFHIEMLFLLPVCMYTVYTQGFGNRRVGFTGPEELLYLIYSFVTAFTTLVCVNDVFYWDEAMYDHKAKNVFLWQLYGPWVLIREFPMTSSLAHFANLSCQPPSCSMTCIPGCCAAYEPANQ